MSQSIPVNLRVDDREHPIGLGNRHPRLSWRLDAGTARGVLQKAFEVRVVDEAGGLAWQSGRVASDRSIDLQYEGDPLRSRVRYEWRARVWEGEGTSSGPWSEPSWWEMGLLESEDWEADWIGAPDPEAVPDVEALFRSHPAPLFRTVFSLAEAPLRGRAYVTALGLYEAWINGTRVGNQVLAPGWTDYHRRIQYQTYDVGGLLTRGQNAIAVLVGNGWYCGHVASLGPFNYGDAPALLLQLEVETADETSLRVVSDETWRTTPSAIISDDLLMGETEDARSWPSGWKTAECDDSEWARAVRSAPPGAELVAPVDDGTSVVESLEPIDVAWRDGKSIIDMGQNMVGQVRLELDVDRGVTAVFRHAEMLLDDGSPYTANLRTARQTDAFVAPGGSAEFQPRFTYHGFRFVEVAGLPGPIWPDQVSGLVISADIKRSGDFSCSDPMLDRLQRNIFWGLRGNFVSVPTDCPQRDERLGWSADAQVFAPTAAFNANVLPFLRKWLIDLEDAQLPSGGFPDVAPGRVYGGVGNAGWGDAGILLPWVLHTRYGVTDVLERHYEAMRRHLGFLVASSTNLIRSAGRYGDWVSLEGITPKAVIGTAYFAHCARVLSHIARVVGDDDESERYEELHRSVRDAFVDRFVSDEGIVEGGTQVGLVLALAMELLPPDQRSLAAARLASDIESRDGHLATGFLGTPLALPVLSDHGYHELACRIAQQRTLPSWGFQVEHGATTLWERWDGWTPERGVHPSSQNSFNHYAFGSVGDWLYRYVGGLDPDPARPGYGHVRIRPRPGGSIDWARIWHESPYGLWEVEWRLSDGAFVLEASIPPNATADVTLPAKDPSAVVVDPGDEADPLLFRQTPEGITVSVGSGRFRFQTAARRADQRG